MARVSFHVVDAGTGGPVAGARVGLVLWVEGDEPGLLQGVTDQGGNCSFEANLAGAPKARAYPLVRAPGKKEWGWNVRGRRMGPDGKMLEPDEIGPGDEKTFEAELEPGPTLAGRVTDASGSPVAGARIDIIEAGDGWCSWPHAYGFGEKAGVSWPPVCITDEDGRYEFLSCPFETARERGARFVLHCRHERHAPAMVQSVDRMLPGAGGIVTVDVTLEEGAKLTGRVLGPRGGAVEGAHVLAVAGAVPLQPT